MEQSTFPEQLGQPVREYPQEASRRRGGPKQLLLTVLRGVLGVTRSFRWPLHKKSLRDARTAAGNPMRFAPPWPIALCPSMANRSMILWCFSCDEYWIRS